MLVQLYKTLCTARCNRLYFFPISKYQLHLNVNQSITSKKATNVSQPAVHLISICTRNRTWSTNINISLYVICCFFFTDSIFYWITSNFSDLKYNIDHQYEQKGALQLRKNTDLSAILEVSYQSSFQPHGRMCYQSKYNFPDRPILQSSIFYIISPSVRLKYHFISFTEIRIEGSPKSRG